MRTQIKIGSAALAAAIAAAGLVAASATYKARDMEASESGQWFSSETVPNA